MAVPYEGIVWSSTQKGMPNQLKIRFEFGGFVLGPDDELAIVRHPHSSLPDSFQTQLTAASQTGLNIIIKDTREVVALKLTDDGTTGDFMQAITIGTDGSKATTAKIASDGTFSTGSLAILKANMKDLTEKQIEKIFKDLRIYRYEFLKTPGTVYVGPEAAAFHELTGYGDGTTIAPGTVAGLALRLVQWVWKKVMSLEELVGEMKLVIGNMHTSQQRIEDRISSLENSGDKTDGATPEV